MTEHHRSLPGSRSAHLPVCAGPLVALPPIQVLILLLPLSLLLVKLVVCWFAGCSWRRVEAACSTLTQVKRRFNAALTQV